MDLVITSCMLLGPPKWASQIMQLTFLSGRFEAWLFALAIGGFLLSWVAEREIFPRLARVLGKTYLQLRPRHRKQRRQYKVVLEDMLE